MSDDEILPNSTRAYYPIKRQYLQKVSSSQEDGRQFLKSLLRDPSLDWLIAAQAILVIKLSLKLT